MSDTQNWQQLKNLLTELPTDSLDAIRTIEVGNQNYYSSASSGTANSIEDIGSTDDSNPQTWEQLLNLLNSVEGTVLEQIRTISIEGEVFDSVAVADEPGNPKEVVDKGKKPD